MEASVEEDRRLVEPQSDQYPPPPLPLFVGRKQPRQMALQEDGNPHQRRRCALVRLCSLSSSGLGARQFADQHYHSQSNMTPFPGRSEVEELSQSTG